MRKNNNLFKSHIIERFLYITENLLQFKSLYHNHSNKRYTDSFELSRIFLRNVIHSGHYPLSIILSVYNHFHVALSVGLRCVIFTPVNVGRSTDERIFILPNIWDLWQLLVSSRSHRKVFFFQSAQNVILITIRRAWKQ